MWPPPNLSLHFINNQLKIYGNSIKISLIIHNIFCYISYVTPCVFFVFSRWCFQKLSVAPPVQLFGITSNPPFSNPGSAPVNRCHPLTIWKLRNAFFLDIQRHSTSLEGIRMIAKRSGGVRASNDYIMTPISYNNVIINNALF